MQRPNVLKRITSLLLLSLACLTLVCGCKITYSSRDSQRLSTALIGLSPDVSTEEAARFAETAFSTSCKLAREYRVVRLPQLHNCLVNVGLRERGLCYHWADDLRAQLHSLQCQTLEIHPAVASMASMREHNAIVITAKGTPFTNGIVLDPWRGSGSLYWGIVRKDRYPWRPAPPQPSGPEQVAN